MLVWDEDGGDWCEPEPPERREPWELDDDALAHLDRIDR